MNDRVLNIVIDADLRCNHGGLALIAKENLKFDVRTLKAGEYIFFVNHSWTMIKALGNKGEWMLHYKNKDGDRLNAKAIRQLPRFARGHDIGYSEALTEVIEAEYSHRYPIASKKEQ